MKKQLVHLFKDPNDVANGFAHHFYNEIETKDNYTVALSGGSTPKLFFDILAREYHDLIYWENIQFFWGDERCVPPDDPESNFKMTYDHLFSKIDIPESNVHRIHAEEGESEVVRYGSILDEYLPNKNGYPQFDLVILGMGADGHTASIFPDSLDLLESKENCALAAHPDSGQKRITLTGSVINNASKVSFLVTGENKQNVLKEIHEKSGNYKDYPASYINPTEGELHWFMDKSAFPE